MLKFYHPSISDSPQNYIVSRIYFVSSLDEDAMEMKIEDVIMKKFGPKLNFTQPVIFQ